MNQHIIGVNVVLPVHSRSTAMTKTESIISSINCLQNAINDIKESEKKGVYAGAFIIKVEVAIRKAKKNLEWLLLMESVNDV